MVCLWGGLITTNKGGHRGLYPDQNGMPQVCALLFSTGFISCLVAGRACLFLQAADAPIGPAK